MVTRSQRPDATAPRHTAEGSATAEGKPFRILAASMRRIDHLSLLPYVRL